MYSAPWITCEYLSFRDRSTYYSTLHDKCPCYYHDLLRKDAQRVCQRSKNSLKRDYVKSTLDRHKDNPKKIWQSIRNFWPGKKQDKTSIKSLNGLNNNKDIANELNKHFCTTGTRIQNDIDVTEDMAIFPPPVSPPVFDFSMVSDDQVAEAICRLSNTRACGTDQITSFMLKAGKAEILPVLTHIFNLSVREKTFPTMWKHARVTPLYKSGPRNQPDNYRPISVLPTVGKIFERLIHTQCQKYLTDHHILTEAQAGFRKGRSTGTCLAEFLHNIYGEIDRGNAVGVLFLDLAKAFDSVDHELLLDKLRLLGFKANSVAWFKSYLKDRYQVTAVGGCISDVAKVECGVPQGSILGPLLFLCFLNDLPIHLKHCIPSLYADDTALLYADNNILSISNKLNVELRNVFEWFCRNKLKVNPTKTKCMLFHSRRKFRNDSELLICLNRTEIEQVDNYKYLGLHLDTHLSFDKHIDIIGSKIKQRTRLLWKMRSFIDQNLALDLYNSLIEPMFIYCSHLYDGTTKFNQNRLQVLQNQALRAVMKVNSRFSATEMHETLNVD